MAENTSAGTPERPHRRWASRRVAWLHHVRVRHPGPAMLLSGRAIQLVNGLLLSTILVRRFGLEAVGSFAIGIAAVNVLASVCPLGLGAYLPRLKQSHAQSCFAGLLLFLAQLPAVVPALLLYAQLQGESPAEQRLIFFIALSGYCIGLANLGMMLSIMVSRFYPGLLAPLCETAGVLAGSLLSRSPEDLALSLLLSRVVSVGVIWVGFRLERLPLGRVVEIAGNGVRYLAPDVLTILSEHSLPLVLAKFVSRSELGMFRLCQQLLMAADSPAWTFVQSKYPQMVEGGPRFVDQVDRQVRRMGLVASAVCLFGSVTLAFLFFHTPMVALLMTLLSGCLAWRYKSYLYGQALRAAGRVAAVTGLGVVRLFTALFLFYFSAQSFGLWGAVLALALLSVAAGITYEHVYHRPATRAEDVVINAAPLAES